MSQPESNKRLAPDDLETRGVVDQVVVPAVIAFSGGAGLGVGQTAGEAIVAKLTKPKNPPTDG